MFVDNLVSLREYQLEKQYKDYLQCSNGGFVWSNGEVFKVRKKKTPEEIRKEMIKGYMQLLSK
ncbi:hypothetical protein [Bacillus smithii]|uniref:hypothetical protein n=1 Tax=Bacillus smithii TaxID=1479 RepID=UPI003D23507E